MNKQIFYHPEECEHCQHFDSNTWNGKKPLASWCYGFGEKQIVRRDTEEFTPCPKFKQKREKSRNVHPHPSLKKSRTLL